MQTNVVLLKKYQADEGKVFDWKEPRFHTEIIDDKEVEVQDHLYAKQLFMGESDSIENYIELEMPKEL